MKLEAKKLLFDVVTARGEVEQFTAGKRIGDYVGSEMLRAAVERKFEVIGEALFRLRTKDLETFQRISASQQAIAFRNRPRPWLRCNRSPDRLGDSSERSADAQSRSRKASR
jgi:uncharacterized protein with HEPN domain